MESYYNSSYSHYEDPYSYQQFPYTAPSLSQRDYSQSYGYTQFPYTAPSLSQRDYNQRDYSQSYDSNLYQPPLAQPDYSQSYLDPTIVQSILTNLQQAQAICDRIIQRYASSAKLQMDEEDSSILSMIEDESETNRNVHEQQLEISPVDASQFDAEGINDLKSVIVSTTQVEKCVASHIAPMESSSLLSPVQQMVIYNQFGTITCKNLVDIPAQQATILMGEGIERAPPVRVEKNPKADVTLNSWVKLDGWPPPVRVYHCKYNLPLLQVVDVVVGLDACRNYMFAEPIGASLLPYGRILLHMDGWQDWACLVYFSMSKVYEDFFQIGNPDNVVAMAVSAIILTIDSNAVFTLRDMVQPRLQNDDCSVENSVAGNHLDAWTDKACKDEVVEDFSSVSTSSIANSGSNPVEESAVDTLGANLVGLAAVQVLNVQRILGPWKSIDKTGILGSKVDKVKHVHVSIGYYVSDTRHLTFGWEPGPFQLKMRNYSGPESVMAATTRFNNNADTFHNLQPCGENVSIALVALDRTRPGNYILPSSGNVIQICCSSCFVITSGISVLSYTLPQFTFCGRQRFCNSGLRLLILAGLSTPGLIVGVIFYMYYHVLLGNVKNAVQIIQVARDTAVSIYRTKFLDMNVGGTILRVIWKLHSAIVKEFANFLLFGTASPSKDGSDVEMLLMYISCFDPGNVYYNAGSAYKTSSISAIGTLSNSVGVQIVLLIPGSAIWFHIRLGGALALPLMVVSLKASHVTCFSLSAWSTCERSVGSALCQSIVRTTTPNIFWLPSATSYRLGHIRLREQLVFLYNVQVSAILQPFISQNFCVSFVVHLVQWDFISDRAGWCIWQQIGIAIDLAVTRMINEVTAVPMCQGHKKGETSVVPIYLIIPLHLNIISPVRSILITYGKYNHLDDYRGVPPWRLLDGFCWKKGHQNSVRTRGTMDSIYRVPAAGEASLSDVRRCWYFVATMTRWQFDPGYVLNGRFSGESEFLNVASLTESSLPAGITSTAVPTLPFSEAFLLHTLLSSGAFYICMNSGQTSSVAKFSYVSKGYSVYGQQKSWLLQCLGGKNAVFSLEEGSDVVLIVQLNKGISELQEINVDSRNGGVDADHNMANSFVQEFTHFCLVVFSNFSATRKNKVFIVTNEVFYGELGPFMELLQSLCRDTNGSLQHLSWQLPMWIEVQRDCITNVDVQLVLSRGECYLQIDCPNTNKTFIPKQSRQELDSWNWENKGVPHLFFRDLLRTVHSINGLSWRHWLLYPFADFRVTRDSFDWGMHIVATPSSTARLEVCRVLFNNGNIGQMRGRNNKSSGHVQNVAGFIILLELKRQRVRRNGALFMVLRLSKCGKTSGLNACTKPWNKYILSSITRYSLAFDPGNIYVSNGSNSTEAVPVDIEDPTLKLDGMLISPPRLHADDTFLVSGASDLSAHTHTHGTISPDQYAKSASPAKPGQTTTGQSFSREDKAALVGVGTVMPQQYNQSMGLGPK